MKVALARELWLFVAPRRRRDHVDVPYDGEASLGHVVQALGVPLTEVGALLADRAPVDPAYRPQAGVTVQIHPVSRPQRVPCSTGFLLDVHLGTLARRLRLLGVGRRAMSVIDTAPDVTRQRRLRDLTRPGRRCRPSRP